MTTTRGPALVLLACGLAAVLLSQFGGGAEGAVTVFGAGADSDGPLGLGPGWAERIPDIAGGLGLSAALLGALAWRFHEPAVAAAMAVALVLGTAFLVWWLAGPPGSLFARDGEPFAFGWSLWAAAAALALAAVAAAALARLPAAAARAPRR